MDRFKTIPMNDQIQLSGPHFMTGDSEIELEIKNTSGERVQFMRDFGIRFFTYLDDEGWVELSDNSFLFGIGVMAAPGSSYPVLFHPASLNKKT
jgi:hypothetical protein